MIVFPVQNSQKSLLHPSRVSYQDPLATAKILSALDNFTPINKHYPSRVAICIGSDRSTGDALGPLVGTFLSSLGLPAIKVWGTLAQPVHALNLKKTISDLAHCGQQSPLVVAVDASLGRTDHIGTIEIGPGPLFPGTGVHKKLPPVGHIYLSGVVNIGGFMEQMVLQSTRLYQVIQMATTISMALKQFLAPPEESGRRSGRADQEGTCLWHNFTGQKGI